MIESDDSKIEWVRLIKRVAEPLLHIQVFSGKKYYEEVTGIKYRLKHAKFEDWFYWISKEDLVNETNAIKEAYEHNEHLWNDLSEKTENEGEELVELSRELAKHVNNCSNSELAKRFARFNYSFTRFMPFTWLYAVPVERYMYDLRDRMLNKLRESNSNGLTTSAEEGFEILTLPLFRETEVQKEQAAIYEAASMLKDNHLRTNKEIEDRITSMAERFSWIGAMRVGWTYLKEPYDREHYTTIIEALAGKGNPNKQVETLKEKQRLSRAQYERFIKEGIGQDIIEMAELYNRLVFYRSYRGEVIVRSMGYARELLSEAASRFQLELKDLVYFTPDEITQLLQRGTLPDYKPRQIGFKIFFTENQIKIVGGVKSEEAVAEDIHELKGDGVYPGVATGKVRIIRNPSDIDEFGDGEVLVTTMTSPDMMLALQKAAAIITDEGGITCHAALLSRELQVPCVIGTEVATRVLKEGERVEVDSQRGLVKRLGHDAS